MIKTLILARETPISLKDFCAQLLSAELTIESRVTALTGSMSAMYMNGDNGNGHTSSYQANGSYQVKVQPWGQMVIKEVKVLMWGHMAIKEDMVLLVVIEGLSILRIEGHSVLTRIPMDTTLQNITLTAKIRD